MLHRIIQSQAVVELISNETASGLVLLAKKQTQMSGAMYQNRLTPDYLLAEKGGVCGKF
ncbi:ENR1 protein, partial [Indicator maculatus]|nr:ENR1 protein [Indicator maculatus]